MNTNIWQPRYSTGISLIYHNTSAKFSSILLIRNNWCPRIKHHRHGHGCRSIIFYSYNVSTSENAVTLDWPLPFVLGEFDTKITGCCWFVDKKLLVCGYESLPQHPSCERWRWRLSFVSNTAFKRVFTILYSRSPGWMLFGESCLCVEILLPTTWDTGTLSVFFSSEF